MSHQPHAKEVAAGLVDEGEKIIKKKDETKTRLKKKTVRNEKDVGKQSEMLA